MRRTTTLLAGLVLAAGTGITLVPLSPAQAQATSTEATTSESASAVSADERELFALNLYHEGRSKGRDGMIAIGWVVFNRIDSDAFPDSITTVINEPTQNSCQWGWTCDGRSNTPTEAEKWESAQEAADELLSDARPADPTGGAIAFHETFRDTPGWLERNATRTATLGNHHFYRVN